MSFTAYHPSQEIDTAAIHNGKVTVTRETLSVGVLKVLAAEAPTFVKAREVQIWNHCQKTSILICLKHNCSPTLMTLELQPKQFYVVNTLAKITAWVEAAGILSNQSSEIPVAYVTILGS